MKIKKYIFAALGCICLALGTVGVFLPILPTTPFYLLTVFFFANSSQKLHDWFLGTELYQKHLDSLRYSYDRLAGAYFLLHAASEDDP